MPGDLPEWKSIPHPEIEMGIYSKYFIKFTTSSSKRERKAEFRESWDIFWGYWNYQGNLGNLVGDILEVTKTKKKWASKPPVQRWVETCWGFSWSFKLSSMWGSMSFHSHPADLPSIRMTSPLLFFFRLHSIVLDFKVFTTSCICFTGYLLALRTIPPVVGHL